jgi:hypothetical protein
MNISLAAADKATLYIFNISGFGGGEAKISDYNQEIISVNREHYATVELAPGKHVLSNRRRDREIAVLDAVAGETYYMKAGFVGHPAMAVCQTITKTEAEYWMTQLSEQKIKTK